MTLTPQQVDFIATLLTTTGHLCLRARAGTGRLLPGGKVV